FGPAGEGSARADGPRRRTRFRALLCSYAPCCCAGAFVVSRAGCTCGHQAIERRRRMAKPDKVTAVAEIADRFRTSSAAVITEYSGLSVSQPTTLRRTLGSGAT